MEYALHNLVEGGKGENLRGGGPVGVCPDMRPESVRGSSSVHLLQWDSSPQIGLLWPLIRMWWPAELVAH